MEYKPENLYNYRTQNEQYKLMQCGQISFDSPFPLRSRCNYLHTLPRPLIVMGKPRVHTAFSLAECHITVLDSILGIPFEVVGLRVVKPSQSAVSVYCCFHHIHIPTNTHAHTRAHGEPQFPASQVSSSKESFFFSCFIQEQKFPHVHQFRQYFTMIYSKVIRLYTQFCIWQFFLHNMQGSIFLSVHSKPFYLKIVYILVYLKYIAQIYLLGLRFCSRALLCACTYGSKDTLNLFSWQNFVIVYLGSICNIFKKMHTF